MTRIYPEDRVRASAIARWGDLTTEERFWAKVDRRGSDECWPWIGQVDKDGYGRFRVDAGPMKRAHRYALALALGRPLTAGMRSRHSCDNPPCVNPAHLSEGTQRQNLADMVSRGRALVGVRNPNARLTTVQAGAIREAAGTETQRATAERYAVSPSLVSRIQSGELWPR